MSNVRASVNERFYIGVEDLAAPGTAVPALLIPLSTIIETQAETPSIDFKPMGAKMITDVLMQKDWATADLSGPLSFYDMSYWYSSLVSTPTSNIVSGANTLTFLMAMYDADQRASFTGTKGGRGGTDQVTNLLINSINHTFNNAGGNFTGTAIGKNLIDSIAIEANPVAIAKLLVPPKSLRIEVGDALNTLAKLGKSTAAGLNIGDRVGTIQYLDDAALSWSDDVEKAPTASAQITIVHDNKAVEYMNSLRASEKLFCRITCFGPEISAGVKHKLEYTFPFKFKKKTKGNTDDAYTATFDLQPIYDSGLGSWLKIVIVNAMTALQSTPIIRDVAKYNAQFSEALPAELIAI